MKTAARLLLLCTGVLLLATYLPAIYGLLTAQRSRPPLVFYSSIEKRFLFSRLVHGEIRYVDTAGRTYEREEFERLLPLTNWAQVSKDGRMPKEIDGVPITLEAVRRAQFTVRLKPALLDSPLVPLAPLLEAGGQRARLELPPDFLRLGTTVEFLDPKSNRVLPAKSARFAAAFAAAGFQFPVTFANSNPTNRKPYDEGFYLVDAAGAVFQLRQIRGEPELRRVAELAAPEARAQWAALHPRYIHVQEIDSRELHAVIVDQAGAVHVALGPDYRLVTLPLRHYDPVRSELTIRGNLLHRIVVVESPGLLESVVLDRSYQPVARYEEALPLPEESLAGRVARVVFPFQWQLESPHSGYLGCQVVWGSAWTIALNALSLLGWCVWRRRAGRLSWAAWPEALAVSFGGIFGLLSAWLLPRAE